MLRGVKLRVIVPPLVVFLLADFFSRGIPLWDYLVRKAAVLYLALEDDYRRLQERLYRMFGTDGTDNLFF